IEGATSAAEVLDRTGVIIEIFHRHASSRPARLQVEIARLTYVAPRSRATGGGERQRGGIGLRGAGESSVELDRRKVRDRISELKAELAAIDDESKTRRARRQEALRVALVGYTNAGKPSLMRSLTGSLEASLLLQIVDAADPAFRAQLQVTRQVLDEIGAGDVPWLLVLNKIDKAAPTRR